MTETTRRTTRVAMLLAALITALVLNFSSVAQADLVDFGKHGAVHNGQPTEAHAGNLGGIHGGHGKAGGEVNPFINSLRPQPG